MKRRNFLQQTGLALAAWSAGEIGLSPVIQRYQQALATPTPRKLALLVGINQYGSNPLSGCVTDVELQRELLIYRFGFQPQDILTLIDQQATRAAIETAFVSHLVEQAKAEDVVVFHFSGYGSTVIVDTSSGAVQNSLVPIDDGVSEGEAPIANDLLEDTLWLLLRSLRAEKATTVLDTSYLYSGKSLQGNLRVRARPTAFPVRSSEAALAFQVKLLNQGSTNSAGRPPVPGVLLTAARPDQLATEARWDRLNAGLFTYSLTQQIWQATPATTLRTILRRTKEQVEQLASQEQQPQLGGQKSKDSPLAAYYLIPTPASAVDGVLQEVEDDGRTALIWLGGLPANLLEQIGPTSLLALVDEQNAGKSFAADPYLQLLSHDGLVAKARLYRTPSEGSEAEFVLKVGQFVRERIRVLPRNIGLTVALDSNLERIERVDAVSAFTAIPRMSSAIAGEQSADYLFSKIQNPPPTQVASAANLAGIVAAPSMTQSSYGLFSLGQDAIPNTAGEGGEAVKVAIRRLVPKLQTLLAAKLLNLTVNEKSSLLPVQATLERLDPKVQSLQQRKTLSATSAKGIFSSPAAVSVDAIDLLSLPVGSQIQYRVQNQSSQRIYFILLSLESGGNLITLSSPLLDPNHSSEDRSAFAIEGESVPPQPDPSLEQTFGSIAAGETLTLPQTPHSFPWVLRGPTGFTETYLICSRAPFTQTLLALGTASRPTANVPALHIPENPLEVAQAVLHDLNQASNSTLQLAGISSDTFALDMSAWANFRFIYQVVG
ncbi:MAG: caspase family protein [Kovacikia sp.]